jgi:hypothetical protein
MKALFPLFTAGLIIAAQPALGFGEVVLRGGTDGYCAGTPHILPDQGVLLPYTQQSPVPLVSRA